MKKIVILALALLGFAVAPLATSAQTITTPYWCQSGQSGYWSSQPCGYYQSFYSYPHYLPAQAGNNNYYYPYNNYYGNYYGGYYGYTYPTPTCSLTYSYANTGNYYGYSYPAITLSWSSSYASSGYINPSVGYVSSHGMQVVYPSGPTTYTMNVYGPGGSNSCSTTFYLPAQAGQQYQYYPYYNNQYYLPAQAGYQYPYQYQYGYPYY